MVWRDPGCSTAEEKA
jgi:hypothetical protein